MAFQSFSGSFNALGSTGLQTITGLPFQPKVVIFFYGSNGVTDTKDLHFRAGFGAADSNLGQGTVGVSSQNGVTASNSYRRTHATSCILIQNVTSSNNQGRANLTAVTAGGFDLNWASATSGTPLITFFAIGGTDLTDYDVSVINGPGSTGPFSISNLTFQPECLVAFSAGQNVSSQSHTNSIITWGAATTNGDQFAISETSTDNKNPSDAEKALVDTHMIHATTGTGVKWFSGIFTSMDANGYTLNADTSTSARFIVVVALKGGKYKIGKTLQPTTPQIQNIGGVGFTPKGGIFASASDVASAAITADSKLMLGSFSALTQQNYFSAIDIDNVSPTQTETITSDTKAIGFIEPGRSVSAAEATVNAFNAGGIDLNWTKADAVARESAYLFFGDIAVTTSGTLSGTITGTVNESQIVTGGLISTITIANDTVVALGAAFDAVRQDILNLATSAQSELLGWNNEVRDKTPVTAVTRVNDTTIQILWPAAPLYNITAQETIQHQIPATALVTSVLDIPVTPVFTVDFLAAPVIGQNYSITVPDGVLSVRGGRFLGMAGGLNCGDSNICGNAGGFSAALDRTDNTIYQWNETNSRVEAINTLGLPFFNHSLNSGLNEVGPDVKFCDRFNLERYFNRRIVGLPCGDSGSGFSTNQWLITEQMYALAQTLVNNFLADNPYNTLEYIMLVLGANDTTSYNQAQWAALIDTLINEFRSTAFNTTVGMPSFANVPVIICGLAPDFYTGTPARQAIQDAITDTPNRLLRTGYANTDGLTSPGGDPIHLDAPSQRELGYNRAWTALLAAEANI